MLSHERGAFTDLGYGRMSERVEEVVLVEDELPLDALRIDVFYRLERPLKLPAWSRGDASSGEGELRLDGSFGGVIARNKGLGGNAERRRGPQLGP